MYLIDVKRKIGDLRTVGRAGVDIKLNDVESKTMLSPK